MSHHANQAIGYQRWGVTNPWVWADYGQPQRLRGQVSPVVMQMSGHFLKSPHLGQVSQTTADSVEARGRRMELMSIAGLALSAASFAFFMWNAMKKNGRRRRPKKNPRRRRGHR